MRILLIALFAFYFSSTARALDIKDYQVGKSAMPFHEATMSGSIRTFSSDSEASAVMQRILATQGLNPDIIEIRSSGQVANAAAFLHPVHGTDGKLFRFNRVIAYNVIFMEEIRKKTGRYWSLISILAHEIGHHLHFQFLDGTPDKMTSLRDELRADYFSGHVLARMGASLDDALAAMRGLAEPGDSNAPNNDCSPTHPCTPDRLQAIALGWKAAKGLPVAMVPSTNISRATELAKGAPISYWEHNKSIVYLEADGARRRFYYHQPRTGIEEEGVRRGTLLFDGRKVGEAYQGMAYVFSRRCGVFPYQVTGRGEGKLVALTGRAVSKLAEDCTITEYRDDFLKFDYLSQE